MSARKESEEIMVCELQYISAINILTRVED